MSPEMSGEAQESYNDDETVENIGLGCALEYFSESEEVMKMIHDLRTVYSTGSPAEKAYERFLKVLTLYQEQRHLLDPYLEKMLNSLVELVRNNDSPMDLKHASFKYLQVVIKVRGYKVVVRHLPHEVSDMEPVLTMLENIDPKDIDCSCTRNVLLLWLSIIVMMPFHMSRLDSFEPGDNSSEGKKTMMSRVYEQVKLSLRQGLHIQYESFLAARFLTRSDVKEVHLASFLNWCKTVFSDPASGPYAQSGVLASVAAILKHGKREDLLPHAPNLLSWIMGCKYRENQNSLIRKYGVKVMQRIGLTFLKTRVAIWRYERGCRSLLANLSGGDTQKHDSSSSKNLLPSEDTGEEFEIPEEMEEVIEELMQALRDSEMVIRWSAAKGIGRVTGRLPKDLADEVVGSVLEMFNPRESDGAWHGGCLALAELGRRGLLVPERLSDVVPVVLKALVYDEPRGYFSVGSHIRDAACFVCWAFARAYDKEILLPFVNDIAGALLVVASFDREASRNVNCRRAGSAAFQENVGRQGTFPHGIDILTAADYFSVGVRNNAFLNISVFIAQFEEYTQVLINHLVDKKVEHWDVAIRELSAKALHNLTPRAPTYMSEIVLGKLLEKTNSVDLNVRHGAIIAIAEILHALFVSLDMSPKIFLDVVREWQALLDECFSHESINVRARAASALPVFLSEYCRTCENDSWVVKMSERDALIGKYTEHLTANNETTRMGFALAIGSLPDFILKGQLHIVLPALITCTQVTETTVKWAESRRDALKALVSVCTTVGVDTSSLDKTTSLLSHLDVLFDCFFSSLMEYTLDSRGDIGAWVREAAMSALQTLTLLVLKADPSLLKPDLVKRIVASVSQQAVERIDRTRAHAGNVFCSLIHSNPPVPNIPHHEQLLEIFPPDECRNNIVWISASNTFPKFVQLLRFPEFTYHILLGLFVSIGGITESLVKHSSNSFFSLLKEWENDPKELNRICDTIIELFIEYHSDNRVVCPLYGFLDRLLGSGHVSLILKDADSKFASEILRLVRSDIQKIRDHKKRMGSIDVLCQLIQVKGPVSKGALVQLSIFLCSYYLTVRRATAAKLYESLLLYGDESIIPEENLDEVMTVLSETDWEDEVANVKPIRNSLCGLMNIPVPKVVTGIKK
ncbi:Tubulin-specific chaperone D [Gryllus bimaculatus]|nr:Tubulin-specific chaperone D [Gryllus bimaculatus]